MEHSITEGTDQYFIPRSIRESYNLWESLSSCHAMLTAIVVYICFSNMIDEVALYDRQIRLWGLEAQHRYSRSRLFFFSIRSCYTRIISVAVVALHCV